MILAASQYITAEQLGDAAEAMGKVIQKNDLFIAGRIDGLIADVRTLFHLNLMTIVAFLVVLLLCLYLHSHQIKLRRRVKQLELRLQNLCAQKSAGEVG